MGMAEEVGHDCDNGSDDLDRDVPARANDLGGKKVSREPFELGFGQTYPENHAQWKDDSKGKHHQEDMDP